MLHCIAVWRPCFRRDSLFSSSSPYRSAAQLDIDVSSRRGKKSRRAARKVTNYMAVSFNIKVPSAWLIMVDSAEGLEPVVSVSSNSQVSRRLLCIKRG